MRTAVVVAVALAAFTLGALIAGAAAGTGPMAGWTAHQMMDSCRGMMGTMGMMR